MRFGAVAFVVLTTLAGGVAAAASVSPSVSAEAQRGAAAVGSRASDEPALRHEAETHTPSQSFVLGAALAAWRNTSAALAYDMTHPAGDGGEAGILTSDCFDEKIAFGHLEAASSKLGLAPRGAIDAAGLSGDLTAAWSARRLSAPARCQ